MHVQNTTDVVYPLALAPTGDPALQLAPTLFEVDRKSTVEIPDEQWFELRKNRGVKLLIDKDCLRELESKPKARPVGADDPHGIKGMSASEAVEYIAELVDDIPTLRIIKALDERKTVQSAVDKRMRELGGD